MATRKHVGQYLEWSEQNVKARGDFFASLNFENIAEEFQDLTKRPKKDKLAEDAALGPARKSARLKDQQNRHTDTEPPVKNSWLEDCAMKHDSGRNLMLSNLKDCAAGFRKPLKSDWPPNRSIFQVTDVTSVTGVTSLITSTAIHPGTETILTAFGSQNGKVAFVALPTKKADDAVHRQFNVHEGPVSALAFDSEHLLSASKDGTVRMLFLKTGGQGFQQIYSVENNGVEWNKGITGLQVGYRNDGSFEYDMWVSQANGCLVRLDSRGGSRGASIHHVSKAPLNSISWCPSENLLYSASRDATVALWDARRMPTTLKGFPLAVWTAETSVAFVSCNPLNPSLILTANNLNTSLELLRYSPGEKEKLASITNIDFHGDIPSETRPIWHPTIQDTFAIGGRNGAIKMCTASKGSFSTVFCHDLRHQTVAVGQRICKFHPTKPIIFGVSSSSTASFFHLEQRSSLGI